MSPAYIIIRGPLGVGKTTVSKLLTARLQALYVSVDDVLATHKLDVAPDGEGIPIAHFLQANALLLPEMQRALTSGQDVIIDGNFYHQEQMDDLEQRLAYSHEIFTLQAPLEICIARDANRPHSLGADAAAAVYAMATALDAGIQIDVSDRSPQQTVETILTYVNQNS